MAYLPTDVANQALDAAGVTFTMGDLEEGTRPAQVLLRAYLECLKQLLRSAPWDFARKTAPLTMLADSSGQTPGVGNQVPVPWLYEYAYPLDCVKARFVPWNWSTQNPPTPPGNISIPSTPLVTGLGQPPLTGQRIRPARFTIATDFNNPPPGQVPIETPTISPQGRTVVLTNVLNAQLVYTAEMDYPTNWDALFRSAFVAYLASEVALPLAQDKKFGLQMRNEQIKIAKQKITEARITDGNEGWYSSDIRVDWMSFRNTGGARWNGAGSWIDGGGPGVLGYGWDQCSFSDGSAY